MKDGFLKIAAASPNIRVADPIYNAEISAKAAREAANSGAKILLFPELCLSGATAGDLFFQSAFIKKCEAALENYLKATVDLDLISFLGLPVKYGSKLYDGVAVISHGELLGISTRIGAIKNFDKNSRYFASFGEAAYVKFANRHIPMGDNIVYTMENEPKAKIFVEIGSDCEAPLSAARSAALSGANVILGAMAYPEYLGLAEREERRIAEYSEGLLCAYAVASASLGESGTDGVYAGRKMIAEIGDTLASAPLFSDDILYGVIDVSKSEALRTKRCDFDSLFSDFATVEFSLEEVKTDPAAPDMLPFVFGTQKEREARAELALAIQAKALACRIERARARGCVLGVSGGLDSTLAVLVCERAMTYLGRDKTDVIAITMPCFGTSERTKSNALALAEELGLSVRTIDIKAAVSQHFSDIGQAEDNYDVVYENAQARERTQILMDVANKEGSIVVGTGDLSELILGFATYNGDQMSMYSVNGSVPKTLMRDIIRCYAKSVYKKGREKLAKVLLDVIDTPVSPELLPTDDGKENTQHTESIVGPYELQDFFLYYTVKYGFGAGKIKRLALLAFGDKYTEEQISEYQKKFLWRFSTQQFKRSCMPDGPLVTEISLSPRGAFVMPSDADPYAIFEEK